MPGARHELRPVVGFDPKTLFENDGEDQVIEWPSKNLLNNKNRFWMITRTR